jgi:tetratricopeptide (TPR) repeat protein
MGVLARRGPALREAERVYGASILDVAPTVLTMLGLAVGADMDGRVLVEAWRQPPAIDHVFGWDAIEGPAGLHPADLRQDPFEAQQAMQQLADLGYIQAPTGDAAHDAQEIARDARFNLAVVYLSTRRPAAALPILEELHASPSSDARVTTLLAQCYADLGRYERVAPTLRPLLETGRAGGEAQILSAAALIAQGRTHEALEILERADQGDDRTNVVACLLGDAYGALRRWADAERAFRRAALNDPEDPRAHLGVGLALLNQEQFEAAAEQCLKAVELRHFLPEGHYYLGVALTWMKEYEHAIRSFEVALSMQAGYLDAHRYLATIHRHLGNSMDAGRHRQIADRLMADRDAGRTSLAASLRETPLGPTEWGRQSGSEHPRRS